MTQPTLDMRPRCRAWAADSLPTARRGWPSDRATTLGGWATVWLLAALAAGCSEAATTPVTTDVAVDVAADADAAQSTDGAAVDVAAPDVNPPDAADADVAGPDTAHADAADADPVNQDASSADAAGLDAAGLDAAGSDAAGSDGGGAGDVSGDAASDTLDAGPTSWTLPTCTTPTGAPGVAFGPKGGATLQISTAAVQLGKTYTMGLTAVGAANVLYAEHAGTVYHSTDAGCAWTPIGSAPTSPLRMIGAPGHRAYAFYDNGQTLVRLDNATVTTLTAPTANLLGLGVHPKQADVVRVGGTTGQLWQNTTAGSGLWQQIGKAAVSGGTGYRVGFSPLNLDRVIYGAMTKGLFLTTDGGKSWAAANFVGAITPQNLNGMNVAFSPVEESTVWAMAIDLNESLQIPSKTNGKYLWRSTDGGGSFSKVVAHLQVNDVTLTNGVHLRPDATDANVVRWAFGTCFSGYGTNLYRYDDGAPGAKLTWVNHPIAGIVEIVHHPAAPDLLVLGLRADDNPQCP